MSPTPIRLRWKATDADALLWEAWDDEYVVYHVPAGKTHFLNAAGARALRLLAGEEADLEAIAAAIAGDGGSAPDQRLLEQIGQTLLRFEHLGLVQRVVPTASDRP